MVSLGSLSPFKENPVRSAGFLYVPAHCNYIWWQIFSFFYRANPMVFYHPCETNSLRARINAVRRNSSSERTCVEKNKQHVLFINRGSKCIYLTNKQKKCESLPSLLIYIMIKSQSEAFITVETSDDTLHRPMVYHEWTAEAMLHLPGYNCIALSACCSVLLNTCQDLCYF